MEPFGKLGDYPIDFFKVGDAEKAASEGTVDEIKRFWEVGNGKDATRGGIAGFCEVGNAENYGEKLFCGVNEADKLVCEVSGAENPTTDAFVGRFYDVGDVEAQYWVSPRISFSQDFVMSDNNSLSDSNPSRVSADRKKVELDIKDNYSAEFEFLKGGTGYGPRDQAKGFMLSADELFFDGKLLPLPLPSIWAASDDLGLSISCDQHRQEAEFSRQTLHNRPMARHLSFEIPKPSSSSSTSSSSYFSLRPTCGCISPPSKNSQLGMPYTKSDALILFSSTLPPLPLPLPSSPSPSPSPSSSSSPSPPPPPPPPPSSSLSSLAVGSSSVVVSSASLSSSSISSMPSTSSLPSSSVTKCSAKLKDLFKSKRSSKVSSSAQLTRDNSVTSTCRLPISSRSFWPFSRSNSAGESKSTTPPPLPCRSNSAGESHTCNAVCPKELDAFEVARLSTSSSIGPLREQEQEQGSITTVLEEHSHIDESMTALELDTGSVDKNTDVCNHGADTIVGSAEIRSTSENVRNLGSQRFSKASGKKVVGTSGKGSPGRRRGPSSGSSGGKTNGGKMVLRNLERCSAEKKLGRDGWRGLNRRGSFPVGARVSPVLNVAVYRGTNMPKIGLFGFNSLLSPKKEKPTEVAINWRNGA